MRAIIVEDSHDSVFLLRTELDNHWMDLEILAVFDNYEDGISYLKKNEVDLVFLDLNLGVHNGMDLFKDIEGRSFEVIITTASRDFGIEAFRHDVLDYLMKPIETDHLLQAKAKFLEKQKALLSVEKIQSLFSPSQGSDKLVISTAQGQVILKLEEVVSLQSDRNYTIVETELGEKYMASSHLGYFEKKLGSKGFVRVNRHCLVAKERIKQLGKGRTPTIILDTGATFDVSARRSKVIRALIGS